MAMKGATAFDADLTAFFSKPATWWKNNNRWNTNKTWNKLLNKIIVAAELKYNLFHNLPLLSGYNFNKLKFSKDQYLIKTT